MTEFAINVSIAETTKFVPFELNRGYMPSMLKKIWSDDIIPKGIKSFAEAALQNLVDVHDAIIEACVFQMSCVNAHRRTEPEIVEGSLVYLSTKNLNLLKGRARKLCLKFVGPWKVLRVWPDTSTYKLDLPTALREHRIDPIFHISLLRPYNVSNDTLFPNRIQTEPYNFRAEDDQEWFVDEIIGHRWDGRELDLEVRWSQGDTTWEPLSNCWDLAALDRYMELQGVRHPAQLARCR